MKSIYLILDMQNDLVHADGPNGNAPLCQQVRARNIIDHTSVALEKARKAGIAVGFVRVGFSAGYPECPTGSQVFSGAPKAGLFKLGEWGTEIHPALKQETGDVQVIKHRVSPFYSTTLEVQLRAQGIQRIYCSGVSTQAVLQATVRDAHDRDFDVWVLEDCCAAHSEEEHRNSMQSIARFCRTTDSGAVDFSSAA
jgi:nicotinamidase-related amidase